MALTALIAATGTAVSFFWGYCCHGYNNKHPHKLQSHTFLPTYQPSLQENKECVKSGKASSSFSYKSNWACLHPHDWEFWFWFGFFLIFVLLLSKMPIASGAAGRVDVGIDTSKTWTPQGLKRKTNSTHRKNDSYLQRWDYYR